MIQAISPFHTQHNEPIQIRSGPLPGRFPVGLAHYHVIDPTRKDQQDGVPRQFMVSAFFPADLQEGTTQARLVDIFEPRVEDAMTYLTDGLAKETREKLIRELKSIGLHSVRGGSPRKSTAPYPVLIYYPAGGCHRLGNADVCEALASDGYVVLAVDGPHDASLVVFPDGHLSKEPLGDDYISPGVGDVGYLIRQLDELNGKGVLGGMLNPELVGIFGHSRGGYIANITAFQHDRVKAAASIDSFLWGYMSEGTGLEQHPHEFEAKVRSTSKPVLRLCGRPAGTDPQEEATFCLKRDGGDFIGNFSVVAFPGWSHGDFTTTPWCSGKGAGLLANQTRPATDAGETLSDILTTFFNIHLLGANPDQLQSCLSNYPSLGLADRRPRKLP